ncbi:MAG: hypothetical protein KF893_02375 [Caldilineaceae bacterium]|nr:hypothetical protein [Caldilineaceae bacterium]
MWPIEEDEIDLREYLQVLINWWREIILFTGVVAVIAAGVVLALRYVSAPTYKSAATVAIARVKSDITFDDRYRTLSEQDLQILRGDTRRSALLGLVPNSAVAETVIAELRLVLTEAEQNPAVLLKKVSAEIVTSINGRTDSDLIRIIVESDSPERAALIANAWAHHYVLHVNTLYGSVPAEVIASVKNDLETARADYQAAQNQLESFIAADNSGRLQRLIHEKETIITSIQTGKQTAVQALVDKELAARQQIAAAYIDALAHNQMLGFQKEQEAKQHILEMYINTEIQNRLNAFYQDRQARQEIYDRLINAEIESMVAVFDEQFQWQLTQFSSNYAERQRLESLLINARDLRDQVSQGGDGAAASNGLALTLLKTQIFASSEMLPANLQLNLGNGEAQNGTAVAQEADLAALIDVLENRIALLTDEIAAQSERLLMGSDFHFLEQFDPNQLAAASSVGGVGGVQAQENANVDTLRDAIYLRYQDLYRVGRIAEESQQQAVDTQLFDEIRTLYPELFTLEELSQLAASASGETPLSLFGETGARQLIQLQGIEDLAAYESAAQTVNQSLDLMEAELQDLRAQYESRTARQQQLTQQRDLAWSTFTTLSNKNVELNLSNTAANSEVRFAAPAVPPVDPVEGTSLLMTVALAAVVGNLLAIFIAFLANFMGQDPFLAGRRRFTG